MPHRVALALSCACLLSLLIGCGGGSGLDVEEGRYRLYVTGNLADTLTGPAIVRPQQNGHVGFELGARDGPGLSIELKPRPHRGTTMSPLQVSPGRYDVVAASLLDGPSADSLSGILAFLSLSDFQFTATRGHLSVQHAGEGRVGGRIDLEMAERESDTPGERTVRVTGVLRATTP